MLFHPRFIPRAVAFDTPDQMTSGQIRTAGGTTIVYLIGGIAVILLIQLPQSLFEAVLIGVAAGALPFSPSDLLALTFPEFWREFDGLGDDVSHVDAIRYLKLGISQYFVESG